jgi:hypothetical protein
VYSRDELSSSTIESYNEYGDELVPEATRISSSSTKYNCHSYAWYMQSIENPYWMNDPSSYYLDGSYEESVGNVGDIICYFDITGFNLHSGIVIAREEGTSNGVCGDSNLVTVRSKWGSLGLYEHRGDQCPYTYPYDGEAVYVKYYKVHQHSYTYQLTSSGHIATCSCGYSIILSHVYDGHNCIHCGAYTSSHDYDRNYQWINFTSHTAQCECDAIATQPHAISSNSYATGQRYATCLFCGGFVEKGFVQLNVNSLSVNQVSRNGSFVLPNGVIVLQDEDIEAYLNGTLVFYNKNEVPVTQ